MDAAIKSDDNVDARNLFQKLKLSKDIEPINIITGPAEATVYPMTYPKRGKCLIFNHKLFKPSTRLNPRKGTDVDAKELYCRFKELQFDVVEYTDLKVDEVRKELKKAAKEDHSQNSCFVVCILTHGNQGVLYAYDGEYPTDDVFVKFRGDFCPSLAGKPKLFFIQSCQGGQADDGISVICRESADSEDNRISSFKIPICADFLIAYSTVPGFYAWINSSKGSWFIQSLCQVLQKYAKEMDLLSMLTIVNYKVAYCFESHVPEKPHMHLKKQVPSINSTLTRMIKFS